MPEVTITVQPSDVHVLRRWYVSRAISVLESGSHDVSSEPGGYDDLPSIVDKLNELKSHIDKLGWTDPITPVTVTLDEDELRAALRESASTAAFGLGDMQDANAPAAEYFKRLGDADFLRDLYELNAAVRLHRQLQGLTNGCAPVSVAEHRSAPKRPQTATPS